MPATNQQVQAFCDNRVRPRCTDVVGLVQRSQNDLANIGDVYANLTSSPTWTDGRSDGVPHLATPADILAWNTFVTNLVAIITGATTDAAAALALVQGLQGQWPVIQRLPINPVPL